VEWIAVDQDLPPREFEPVLCWNGQEWFEGYYWLDLWGGDDWNTPTHCWNAANGRQEIGTVTHWARVIPPK
jgi:hypothetical protein